VHVQPLEGSSITLENMRNENPITVNLEPRTQNPQRDAMHILGISCFYHDSAACLIQDGKIRAAAQEERFTRKKHDPRFPKNAVAYCLKEGGIGAQDLDYVVFYDKPFMTFERLLLSYLTVAPQA